MKEKRRMNMNFMYAKEHQVNYHGIDKKQRREIRAKKQAQGHSLTW